METEKTHIKAWWTPPGGGSQAWLRVTFRYSNIAK
jgi:hypothetical protein